MCREAYIRYLASIRNLVDLPYIIIINLSASAFFLNLKQLYVIQPKSGSENKIIRYYYFSKFRIQNLVPRLAYIWPYLMKLKAKVEDIMLIVR